MKLTRLSQEPILTPNPHHPWEARGVFNCTVVHHNDLFHMLYRAVAMDLISTLGYAVSRNGLNWTRANNPVMEPANAYEEKGIEDPRITNINGLFYMVYTAYSRQGTRVSLAASSNLVNWKRMGVILPDENNKDAALFPERINGRYGLLHRRLPDIWIAYSDDLLHWNDHQIVMQPRPNTWEALKIGIAGPPMKTQWGWLTIYHGVGEDKVYRLGVALLDLDNPRVVLKRQEEPILEPALWWEREGDVPNVVFSCGQVMVGETLYVYYGGADTRIGVAYTDMDQIDSFMHS